jgi:hypothetical protein
MKKVEELVEGEGLKVMNLAEEEMAGKEPYN